jgi:hypothetical protein
VEIDQAVEVLNKCLFRGRSNWTRHGNWEVQSGTGPCEVIGIFEALAIAHQYEGTADRLAAELSEAHAARERAEGERDAARERIAILERALESVQWSGPISGEGDWAEYTCPDCGRGSRAGHANHCDLAAALALAPAGREGEVAS